MNLINLLNKTQELNSCKNAVLLKKNNQKELELQIQQVENALKGMGEAQTNFKREIEAAEKEVSIIEPQVNLLYKEVKKELESISNFDDQDPDYLNKISVEQEYVKNLNIVESFLGIEQTVLPQRVINSQTAAVTETKATSETAEKCDL